MSRTTAAKLNKRQRKHSFRKKFELKKVPPLFLLLNFSSSVFFLRENEKKCRESEGECLHDDEALSKEWKATMTDLEESWLMLRDY